MLFGRNKKKRPHEVYYSIELVTQDRDSEILDIKDELFIGNDSKCHYPIEGVSEKSLCFRVQGNILTLFNLEAQAKVVLGKQELLTGRQYIVDDGDSIVVEDLVRINVQAQIVEKEEEEPEPEQAEPEVDNSPPPLGSIASIKDDQEEHIKENEELEEQQESKPKKGFFFKRNSIGPKLILDIPPGLFSRFAAVLLNCSFVFALWFGIFPLLGLEDSFMFLAKSINSEIPKEFTHYTEALLDYQNLFFLAFFALFLMLDLFFSFFFGLSIGLDLQGFSVQGNFVTKRIKAIIRSLISFITTPFLIFDIPAIFNKRTLKDFLTLTHFQSPSLFTHSLTLGLLMPILIILGFFAPTALQFFFSSNKALIGSYKQQKTTKIYSGKEHFISNFNSQKVFYSLPSFDKKTSQYNFKVLGDDFKPIVNVTHLSTIKSSDIESVLGAPFPIYSLFYSNLQKLFQGTPIGLDKTYHQFEGLLNDALSFSAKRPHEQMLKYGPLLSWQQNLRSVIVDACSIPSRPDRYLIKNYKGGYRLLRLWKGTKSKTKKHYECIFFIYGKDLQGIKISYEKTNAKKSKKVLKKILSNVVPPEPVVQYLNQSKIKLKEQQVKALVAYLSGLYKTVVASKDQKLIQSTIDQIKQTSAKLVLEDKKALELYQSKLIAIYDPSLKSLSDNISDDDNSDLDILKTLEQEEEPLNDEPQGN